jgi:tetratricopeptide (TPR) repeat protein
MLLVFVLLIGSAFLPAFTQTPQPQPENALASARQLFNQGKFTEAAAAYRSSSQKDPASFAARAGLVQSYLKADDVKAAEEASLQALTALPQSALIHAVRGDVYFRQGLLVEAANEYKAALKLDEKCARAWLGIGKMDATTAHTTRAKEAFAKAHDLDPHNEDGDVLYRWAVTLPYPKNVEQLEHYIAEFHFDPDQERRNREYLDLVKALAGRSVWVPAKQVGHAEMKIEPIIPEPHRMAGYGIKASLNGKATAMLLLDTGASWATITKKLADKVGARKLSEQALEGTGGSASSASYLAWVDKFTIGDAEFHDCIVHVSPQNDVAGADGLLGTEIFDHNLVTLDINGRHLVLDPLPEPPRDLFPEVQPYSPQKIGARQLFQLGHLLLVPADVNHKALGFFVLDTGSNATALSLPMAEKSANVRAGKMQVRGIGGASSDNAVAENAMLQFSGIPEKPQDLVTTDLHPLSKNLGIEVSGIIGFPSLSKIKVTIDYRDGWVEFESH